MAVVGATRSSLEFDDAGGRPLLLSALVLITLEWAVQLHPGLSS